MTPKQLKTIALALAVLLVLWGASEVFLNRSDRTRGERLFPAISQAQTDSIVIERKADTVHLVKHLDYWAVNGRRAHPNEVDAFFTQLGDSTPPEIAARSSAVHARMGVDSTNTRRVRVYSGGQAVIHVLVGERGPDYQSSYVRRPEEETVYLRYGPFAGFVDRAPDDWRETRMANIVPDSIARVDVTRHGRRYSVVRRDSTWQFADGRPADTDAVTRLLQKFHPANATGFATPEDERAVNFARPDLRVVVRNGRGDTLTHLLGDSMPNGYWVRHDSGGSIFRNGVWIADEIAPHDSTLRRRN